MSVEADDPRALALLEEVQGRLADLEAFAHFALVAMGDMPGIQGHAGKRAQGRLDALVTEVAAQAQALLETVSRGIQGVYRASRKAR